MSPELRKICDDFRAQLTGKSAGWCQLHPRGDDRQWTAQQLVEHLVLAARTSVRVLETRLRRDRPPAGHTTLLERLLRCMILNLRLMPHGAAAPPFIRPGILCWPPIDGDELANLLRQEIDAMDRLLARCEDRFGRRPVATHYLFGPLRPSQWRRFHAVHGRHHLAQLHRIQREVSQDRAVRNELISAEQ